MFLKRVLAKRGIFNGLGCPVGSTVMASLDYMCILLAWSIPYKERTVERCPCVCHNKGVCLLCRGVILQSGGSSFVLGSG